MFTLSFQKNFQKSFLQKTCGLLLLLELDVVLSALFHRFGIFNAYNDFNFPLC